MSTKPRLCFVGPMIGRNPGRVTTQGEILADLFRSDGWHVMETSPHPSRPLRLIDTLWSLLRWHRTVDIAVLSVFSGLGFVMADVTSMLLRVLRIPTIMVLRGGNLPDFEQRHPRWVRRSLARAGLVVAPSQFLAVEIEAAVGAVVIPNVIQLGHQQFIPRTELRPRLLWMRTFHPLYNPLMAVRALDRLREQWPDAVLTMAGQSKGSLEQTQAEVVARNLTGNVRFAGFLTPEGKTAAFAEHDIYLHTNHIDNMPVSVLEAAAAGLPVVGTAVGGMPYLLTQDETALLVPDGDADAMAAEIARLLRDPALAGRLSNGGRALAEDSAWPAVRTRWREAFDHVIAHRSAV